MKNVSTWIAVAILAILTAAIATPALLAQDKNAPKPANFGHVELQKILTDYRQRPQLIDQMKVLQEQYDGVMKRLLGGSARYLSDAEVKQLAAIYEKPNKSAEDNKKASELESKGDNSAAKYRALEQTANPSEAQKQQFAQMSETLDRGQAVLRGLTTSYSERLQARAAELDQKVFAEVRAAVGKVAQDRGLTAVFTSDTVLYTSNDITADVIKAINK